MKYFMLSTLVAVLMLMGCGTEDVSVENASPISVVPERAMVSVILTDPAGIVRNIDSYISEGAPILGEYLLENLICEQLDISNLDSLTSQYGINPSGQIAFWMESAMPQSMALAFSASDFQIFVSLLEEMGSELIVEEPVMGETVYSIVTEEGTKYICGTKGVVLVASTKTSLETMITNLSPDPSFEIEPTSISMKFNISMIGPMAVSQMPLARMMMDQGIAADSTMPAFVPAMLDVYMDGFEILLSQVDMLELTIVAGAENVVIKKRASFVEGSELAEMFEEIPQRDMIPNISQGDLATVRFQMPEVIAFEITKAFTNVFTSELSDETLGFWSAMAANGAVSIYDDDFVHIAAAYELSEETSIEDVAYLYSEYITLIKPVIEQNTEIEQSFELLNEGIIQVQGIDFYNISIIITPEEPTSMEFNYWMTTFDGALLIETSPEPDVLLSIVSGDYVPAELPGTGEFSGEMSIAGYLKLIMTMSPNGTELPDIGSDVIFYWDGSYSNRSISGEMSMNGSNAVATGFAFFGLISAMQ